MSNNPLGYVTNLEPTYEEWTNRPLSLDIHGGLRVAATTTDEAVRALLAIQNAKYDEAHGVVKSITTSAVLFTPLTGHLYAEISAPADIYIRTDDAAVVLPSDGATSSAIYVPAGQPKTVPVTAGVAIRALSASGSAVLVSVTPLVLVS